MMITRLGATRAAPIPIAIGAVAFVWGTKVGLTELGVPIDGSITAAFVMGLAVLGAVGLTLIGIRRAASSEATEVCDWELSLSAGTPERYFEASSRDLPRGRRTAVSRAKMRAIAVPLTLAVAIGIGGAGPVFTMSKAMRGGDSRAVTGVVVSDVSYKRSVTDPTKIESVTFTITPSTAAHVRLQLTPRGAWYSCANAAGAVSCATTSPQATVLDASELTVIASG